MSMIWMDGFEAYDFQTPLEERQYTVVRTEDPYAGLNRAQRRKAIAVETRAERKKRKKRGRRA